MEVYLANLGALNDFEVNSIRGPHSDPNTHLQGNLQTIKSSSSSNSTIWVIGSRSSVLLFGIA